MNSKIAVLEDLLRSNNCPISGGWGNPGGRYEVITDSRNVGPSYGGFTNSKTTEIIGPRGNITYDRDV